MNTFKTSLAAATSAVALLLAAPATAETPAADAAASEPSASGPALWKIADEDTTVYLFGTVHVLPEGKNWFTPAVEAALDGSDILVTEIPTGAATDARAAQLIAELATLPKGTTLRGMMSDEDRATYESALTSLGVPVGAFDAYEPWFASLSLSILPLVMQGYKVDEGVEKVLEAEAGAAQARGALETIEFQMGLFDSGSTEDQLAMLALAAESVAEVVPTTNAMVDEWIEGDADGLAAIINENLAASPELAEVLLYNRNANWAGWIDQRLDEPGTVFVAVGAGHLAGERSVQDYLAQRGIAVDRVQ